MTRHPNQHHTAYRLAIALAAILLTSGSALATDRAPEQSGRDLLNRTLEAHGGLAAWQSYRTLHYTIEDFPLGEKTPMNFNHTADLKNRRHLIVGPNYRLGNDGVNAWAVNGQAAGIPARFVTRGNFYFVGIPFVFADPGIRVSDLGRQTLRGEAYDTIGIRYERGVGDSADDDYIVYLDTETHRVAAIQFAVTYKAIRGDAPVDQAPRKVLTYDEWQEVDGLWILQQATFYDYVDGQVKGDGATYHVTKAIFLQTPADDSLFEVRAGAQIDQSHK